MATYKGIQGFTIQNLSADPSNPIEGQVWYNSTSNVWKVEEATTVGAWATGNNLNTARRELAGLGTQTSAVAAGGYSDPGLPDPNADQNVTELYDGTSWTNSGNLGTARRRLAGAGIQTSAVVFGGYIGPTDTTTGVTEEFNGSTWSPSNPLNTARNRLGGAGIQTAALAFGGTPDPSPTNVTEKYDGTSWTNQNNMNTGRQQLMSSGTQTAALAAGGFLIPPVPTAASSATEEYDGTSWATSNPLNTARWGLAGGGIQTSTLAFGGTTPGNTGATEEYDGTSWATSPGSLATARNSLGGAGTQTAALAFGGGVPAPPTGTNATEEWTGPGVAVTKTITVS